MRLASVLRAVTISFVGVTAARCAVSEAKQSTSPNRTDNVVAFSAIAALAAAGVVAIVKLEKNQ